MITISNQDGRNEQLDMDKRFNISAEYRKRPFRFHSSIWNDDIYLFIICSLGLQGNILVILVYMVNMKTSTRVYMFALAVADLAVCVCAVVVAAADMKYSITFNWLIRTSIYLSATLLVFVSIERLIAVKRPHTFSMDSRRAKRALLDLALTGVPFTTVGDIYLSPYSHYNIWRPLEITLIGSGIMVMIICYTLIAIDLLKKPAALEIESQMKMWHVYLR